MIRALCAALAAFVLGCAAAPPPVNSIDAAVAAILRNDQRSCSAFAIGTHDLMTAAHCLPDAPIVRLESRSGDRIVAEVVYVDSARDTAVMRTPYAFSRFLSTRAPSYGERVQAIAAAFDWNESSGSVASAFGEFRESTLTIQHGWSGSPVIGADGRAVGVVVTCRGVVVRYKHKCSPGNAQFSALP